MKIESKPIIPDRWHHEVLVDGVQVGVGDREECDALRDELIEKPDLARELRDDLRDYPRVVR